MVNRYGIFVSQMNTDMFHMLQTLHGPFLIDDCSYLYAQMLRTVIDNANILLSRH
jgi:hypothetical protein